MRRRRTGEGQGERRGRPSERTSGQGERRGLLSERMGAQGDLGGRASPARGDRRRVVLGGLAAASAASVGALAAPALAQAGAQVVVVGGGAAGATAARDIAREAPNLTVTLVTERPVYTSCFFSNLYLAGFRSLQSLTHRYDLLARRHGVRLAVDRAAAIDRDSRVVRLAGGASLPYDRLVLAPGIALQTDAIEGYGPVAQAAMPHAYVAGYQTYLLKRQLQALPEGGVFVLAAPPNPYRCPPGPYERVSMAALYLSRVNPTAKILIFDAKDTFAKQQLFEAGWDRYYPGMIEWNAASFTGGGVLSVDAAAMTVTTGAGDTVRCDAACIIPPQQAGVIAVQAGLTDAGGWAPVAADTMRSQLDERVFVVGDAARAAPMPKSAFAANSQAHQAALAIRSELSGATLFPARYRNTCWSFLEHQDVVKVGASYREEGGEITAVSSFISEPEDDARRRLDNSLEANAWYAAITADMFA